MDKDIIKGYLHECHEIASKLKLKYVKSSKGVLGLLYGVIRTFSMASFLMSTSILFSAPLCFIFDKVDEFLIKNKLISSSRYAIRK